MQVAGRRSGQVPHKAASVRSWVARAPRRASSLLAELRRDRKRAVCPRDQRPPRQGSPPRPGVAISPRCGFEGFLTPLAHRTLLDDDVMVVLAAVNLDRSEPTS